VPQELILSILLLLKYLSMGRHPLHIIPFTPCPGGCGDYTQEKGEDNIHKRSAKKIISKHIDPEMSAFDNALLPLL
jgi:hypothetical protein